MMEEPVKAAKQISYFFVGIVFVLIVLSFISLYQTVETYMKYNKMDFINLIFSLGAIILSVYFVIQMQKQSVKISFERTKTYTVLHCPACNYKNVREYQNGEYVLKKTEACPKCNAQTFISAIYREPTEEEKRESNKLG